MAAVDWIWAAAALVGHIALCVAFFNRLHAVGMHRKPRRFIELLLVIGFFAAIVWYGLYWPSIVSVSRTALTNGEWLAAINYANLCVIAAIATIPLWILPKLTCRSPRNQLAKDSNVLNVAREVGPIERPGLQGKLFSLVPGNQILHLEVNRKQLAIDALPTSLSGFAITHLSDLHFTGEIGQKYFDYVVDQANALQGDVIVISGDIIESTECERWIPETLGRLRARLGVYFVLGNHDKRMADVPRVRRLLGEIGMIDLGSQCRIVDWNGCLVLLAGNERPWFPAPNDAALEQAAKSVSSSPFRILVSHSPDQIRWAQARDFNLMLAGHNHGGQVCLPLLGPLIAPSLYGTKFAGGLYYAMPTLLHVSRGVSGEHPLRLNCPPEITRLELVCQA